MLTSLTFSKTTQIYSLFSNLQQILRELPNQQICLGKAKFVDESYFLQKENVFRKPLCSNCCRSVYFLQNKGGGVHLFCGRNKYFCKICINRIILTRFPRLRKKLDFQYSKRNSVIFFAQNMRQWYFVDAKFPRCVKSFEGSLLYSFDKIFNWNLFIIQNLPPGSFGRDGPGKKKFYDI